MLLVALLAVGGVVLWNLLSRPAQPAAADQTISSALGLEPGVPTIVAESELTSLSADVGPVYWAGPREDVQYEVTATGDGSTFIRYLPTDVEAGSDDQFLTVGTYSAIDGYTALSSANEDDADVIKTDSGAVVVTFAEAPLSTYFAFPAGSFQVEVFSPEEGESRELTESGAIGLVSAR